MKKISIIVPIYNISKYISKCIESILNQTYENFELILVNDGSTDDSLNVIEKYAYDSRIKIFSKVNGGLSDTRNYGIKKSTGDYIMFVDGDDFLLDENCLEKIISKFNEKELDILQFKMVHYFEKTEKYVYLNDFIDVSALEYWDKIEILNRNSQLSVSACDKVFSSKFLKNNNLFFETNLLSEDVKWFLHCLLKAKNIVLINENIYVYRQQRPGSISTVKGKKHVSDLYSTIKYWLDYDYTNTKIKEIYYSIIAYWYSILRVNFSKDFFTKDMKKDFKYIDSYIFNYNSNSKVKLIYNVKRYFGINIAIILCKVYLFFKRKGVLKI